MKMLYYLKISLIASILLISGCSTNNIYKTQLKKYQDTIGNKFIYYLNNDKEISITDKNKYLEINYETTKLLSE